MTQSWHEMMALVAPPLMTPEELYAKASDDDTFVEEEMEDGTLLVVYWCSVQERFRVGTKARSSAQRWGLGPSFTSQFWQLIGQNHKLDPAYVHVFILNDSRNVVRHERSHLVYVRSHLVKDLHTHLQLDIPETSKLRVKRTRVWDKNTEVRQQSNVRGRIITLVPRVKVPLMQAGIQFSEYEIKACLRGNTPSLAARYLQLTHTAEASKFLDTFPLDKQSALLYEKACMTLTRLVRAIQKGRDLREEYFVQTALRDLERNNTIDVANALQRTTQLHKVYKDGRRTTNNSSS